MLKADLEHIIRAASAITNEYEIIVVGSQSILASVDQPPLECVISKEADIIITTALIPGKRAPLLVTEEMVKTMHFGSVIVDMAVESGGNVVGSEMNKTVQKHGVIIIGEGNIPSLLPMNASDLYAKNIQTLLLHLATKDAFKWEMEEEITKGSLITHQGSAVHPSLIREPVS